MKRISVIAPIYNEKENIEHFVDKVERALRKEFESYEIVLVDDGSTDGSCELLQQLSQNNVHIKNLHFTCNNGQTAALDAGFKHATGEMVVMMDSDLQTDPEEIKIENILASTSKQSALKNILKKSGKEKYATLIEATVTENYQLYIADICDLKALEKNFYEEKPDFLIHLAGLAGVRPSIEDPLHYEKVNIQGSLHLLELCKKYEVKKFIQASSSVYGNCEEIPFQEDIRLDFPISPYAASKKSCELFGHVYASLYQIDMIQLRFFTVYGERQRPDLAIHKFIACIEEGNPITLFGNGSTSRDYTYIDDIVQGICLSLDYLISHDAVFEIINLGSSRKISLFEMVKTIEKVLGKQASIQFDVDQKGDVKQTFASLKKAKQMLGYSANTSFEKGIQNFVNWHHRKEI